ncbi:MAG TPA: hypothetical protein DCY48_04045 [Candidatus Magasanikbacteria bacterium]|nr:MAG: hypothetical protein A3I74_00400 [Candidatus Magasanikbacteria bacterium RIFCSPLOWO2_02_FULL_47_16]OGH80089.1 MAG: hypothetical protein A3C10_02825 [Candidatus Magasanikbacteria bacterium RIFCSPHIGHO2_02_FULL_48_18]OGH83326.1 MAG: hypothetical protein A3G08_00275 [Candidatus Magasanikbacteria bacterium RIFCSPLOWO2_12_FULL_47_9b]HAZ28916.1 hypothetical protein [Candidatus Magasanikbacteria bacterium]
MSTQYLSMRILIFFLLPFVAGCGGRIINTPASNTVENDAPLVSRLPDIPGLQTYDGTSFSLAAFYGKPLVIISWETACERCGEQLIQAAFVRRQLGGVIPFIAINRREPSSVAKAFTDSLGITNELSLAVDNEDFFYRTIGGSSLPEILFVTPERDILFHEKGYVAFESLQEKALVLLENMSNDAP